MNGIRNTYLYVCGSQRLLDIRRIYTSAGLKRLMRPVHIDDDYLDLVFRSLHSYNGSPAAADRQALPRLQGIWTDY